MRIRGFLEPRLDMPHQSTWNLGLRTAISLAVSSYGLVVRLPNSGSETFFARGETRGDRKGPLTLQQQGRARIAEHCQLHVRVNGYSYRGAHKGISSPVFDLSRTGIGDGVHATQIQQRVAPSPLVYIKREDSASSVRACQRTL